MKYNNFRRLLVIGFTLTGLAFSAQTGADECFAESGVDKNTFTTIYGGASLTCPSSDDYIECSVSITTNGNLTYSGDCVNLPDPDPDFPDQDGLINIEVTILDGGLLKWVSYDDPDGTKGIDAFMTDSAKGGQGCLTTIKDDTFMGSGGYQKTDGSYFPAKKVVFCSSDTREEITVLPDLATVEQCVIDFGDSQEIHGVTFSCPKVPVGETRTIIITKDTANCSPNDNNELECEPVPGFGFLDVDGNIDFNNVCQCVGSAEPGEIGGDDFPVLKTECDPDPNNTEGGCEVGPDSETPVVITIQNPRCFWIGGFARCF